MVGGSLRRARGKARLVDQLSLDGFGNCACWRDKDSTGVILAAYACPECVELALAYLTDLLYLDNAVSVSA